MKAFVRLLLAAAVSALLLGLLFKLVAGQAGQPGLRSILARASISFVLVYLFCALAQTFARARRYRLLLQASHEPEVPRLLHIFLVSLARNMFVDLLPARLGELGYVALLNRGYRVGVPACLSSLCISFIFDLVALLVILMGLAAFSFTQWMPGILLLLAAATGIGFAVLFPGLARIAAKLEAGSFPRKLADAFEHTRRAGVFLKTLLLSLAVRMWKYTGFYFMFLAVAGPSFPQMADTPPGKVLVSLISAEAASSLPVPTFMSFGAYEAGGTAAWKALGASAADAALCMLAVHIGSQVIDYALGGLGLLMITLLAGGKNAGRARGLIIAAAISLLAAGAFAFHERRSLQKRGALEAPTSGIALEPVTGHRLRVTMPHGFVVWSSNRSGNHDIWRMDLPGGEVSQITTHPHTETYPRISPDGTSIVFARGHAPWVSQRSEVDWDVIRRELVSGEERIVATNACAPTWADSQTITYQEEATRVVTYDIPSGARTLLCESGKGNIPPLANLQTPQYNAREKLVAATIRNAARMTALVDAKNVARKAARGCQLFWSTDNSRLYYVDHGGRMKNAIYLLDPATLERTLWFDAVGEWSHEYFPKESNDGRWLAYGAAAKSHEHDTADYEIFLWKIGDPFDKAERLTWHTGNDCWPDIYVSDGKR